jgi:hypothetical protein
LNDQDSELAIVNKMKLIVPEFVSKNSKYEKLDITKKVRDGKDTILQ